MNCTCGGEKGVGHYDTTGFCDRGNHESCSGVLRAATGTHYWCVCGCHPSPTAGRKDDVRDLSGDQIDPNAALATYAKGAALAKEARDGRL